MSPASLILDTRRKYIGPWQPLIPIIMTFGQSFALFIKVNKECPTYLWKSSLLETQDNIRPWASEQLPVMLICEPKPIFCPRLMPGGARPMVASEIPELRSFVENYFMLILKLAC